MCVYVVVLPTVVSAMTGYQTSSSLLFHPAFTSTFELAKSDTLSPNPVLTIRDGYRVGLPNNTVVSIGNSLTVNATYNTIVGCK